MDNGFYWVKPNAGDPWEVALYSDTAWWFHGLDHGSEDVEELCPIVDPPNEIR